MRCGLRRTLVGWAVALGFVLGSGAVRAEEQASPPAAEDDPLPAGCKHKFFCYKPPADEDLAPELREKKVLAYIALAFGELFVYGGGAAGAAFLMPSILGAKDKKMEPNADLLAPPFIFGGGAYAAAFVLFIVGYICTLLGFVTLGLSWIVAAVAYIAAVVIWLTSHFYFGPVTTLHAINKQLKKQGGGAATTSDPK